MPHWRCEFCSKKMEFFFSLNFFLLFSVGILLCYFFALWKIENWRFFFLLSFRCILYIYIFISFCIWPIKIGKWCFPFLQSTYSETKAHRNEALSTILVSNFYIQPFKSYKLYSGAVLVNEEKLVNYQYALVKKFQNIAGGMY